MSEVQPLRLRALREGDIEGFAFLYELGETALLSEVDAARHPLVSDLGLDEVGDGSEVLLVTEFVVLDALVGGA